MVTLDIPAAAAATVIASFIGATLTFLVAVFTKENKTSEFRQSWIDALRADVAEFIAIWYFITTDLEAVAKEGTRGVSVREYGQSLKAELIKIEMLQARIELRLNPDEHAELIAKIRQLAKIHNMVGLTFDQRVTTIEEFTKSFQTALKREWKRVKSGELIYQIVKWVGFFGLIALAITLGVAAFDAWDITGAIPENSSKPIAVGGAVQLR